MRNNFSYGLRALCRRQAVLAAGIAAACMLLPGTAETVRAKARQQEDAAAVSAFPDAAFRAAVYEQADLDGDGVLSEEEEAGLMELEVKCPYQEGNQPPLHGEGKPDYDGIPVDVTGMERFPNLKSLSFENVEPAGLQLQKLGRLETFSIKTAPEIELDFSGMQALKKITIHNLKLKKLDVSRSGVTEIDIYSTKFTGPFHGFKGAGSLQKADIDETDLKEADFTMNAGMKQILLFNNSGLKKVRLAGLKKLKHLQVDGSALKSIDVSGNKQLEMLSVTDSRLTEIDVSRNHKLESLRIDGNRFTKIDGTTLKVSAETPLKALHAEGMDKCRVFDVSHIKPLKYAFASYCRLRQVKIGKKVLNFDMYNNKGMSVLDADSFQAPAGTKLQKLYCSFSDMTRLDTRHLKELVYLVAIGCRLKKADVSGNPKLGDGWGDFDLEVNPLEKLVVNKNCTSRQKKKYRQIIKETGGKIVYRK